MTEQNPADLLERAVDRTHVGPPPLEQMLARTRRVRRRRTVLLTAVGSAAVVAVVGGTAALSGPAGNPQREPALAATTSPTPPEHNSSGTALTGTWTVRALVGPDGQSVLPAPYADEVQMTFKNGEMTGRTGCNSVSAPYHQSGDQEQDLVFGQLATTLVG